MVPPSVGDLSGLLAGHGQAVRTERGGRISVVVHSLWRADRIVEEVAATGLGVEVGHSHEGGYLVRTAVAVELLPLAAVWTKGAVKTMPENWTPSPREVRIWALAAGQGAEGQYQLGLDPHAPDTHYPLAGALARLGLTPLLIGVRAGGPALRMTGRRRMLRLVDLLGVEPAGARAENCWPTIAG